MSALANPGPGSGDNEGRHRDNETGRAASEPTQKIRRLKIVCRLSRRVRGDRVAPW
jgi:hypothetical protein